MSVYQDVTQEHEILDVRTNYRLLHCRWWPCGGCIVFVTSTSGYFGDAARST